MKLLMMQFAAATSHAVLVRAKYPSEHPVLKTTGNSLYIAIFTFIDIRREDKKLASILPDSVYI
jgi:hypothetical protein